MATDPNDRICWRTGCRARATHQAHGGAFHCDAHRLFDWTEERVTELRLLDAKGMSAGRRKLLQLSRSDRVQPPAHDRAQERQGVGPVSAAVRLMAPLTPAQKLCLDGIMDLTIDGVGPSYDELREYMGLSSKSGVFRCINALIERGHLRRMPNRARSLEVVEAAVDPYSSKGLDRLDTDSLHRVAGRIANVLRLRAS